MKIIKRLLFLVLILGIGLFAFLNLADNETKRNLFEDIGIDENSILREASLDTYIIGKEIVAKKNMLGKWVIKGWLRNTHPTRTLQEIKFRVNFSNSFEVVSINKSLNPGGLGKPFTIKLSGHKNESFNNWQIVNAN